MHNSVLASSWLIINISVGTWDIPKLIWSSRYGISNRTHPAGHSFSRFLWLKSFGPYPLYPLSSQKNFSSLIFCSLWQLLQVSIFSEIRSGEKIRISDCLCVCWPLLESYWVDAHSILTNVGLAISGSSFAVFFIHLVSPFFLFSTRLWNTHPGC